MPLFPFPFPLPLFDSRSSPSPPSPLPPSRALFAAFALDRGGRDGRGYGRLGTRSAVSLPSSLMSSSSTYPFPVPLFPFLPPPRPFSPYLFPPHLSHTTFPLPLPTYPFPVPRFPSRSSLPFLPPSRAWFAAFALYRGGRDGRGDGRLGTRSAVPLPSSSPSLLLS